MKNPAFKHAERSEYELPQLLKIIGDVDVSKPLEESMRNNVEAASTHAYNEKESLLIGIESIGILLMQIAQLPDPIQERTLLGIGEMIRHASVQLQYVIDVEDEMDGILRRDKETTTKGARNGQSTPSA